VDEEKDGHTVGNACLWVGNSMMWWIIGGLAGRWDACADNLSDKKSEEKKAMMNDEEEALQSIQDVG